jgi:TRAP-type C4-dicarboxylate transport system permease small subunit
MGFIERVGRFGGGLGEAAMVFMVVSISYDVLMRYIFLAPTIWALEVNTFLLVFLCTIPAADTLTAGTQIQITFLTERLPAAVQAKLPIIGNLAGVLFCVVMTWKGASMTWAAFQHNDRMSTSLGTPLAIPYALMPIGFGLLGLTYAARMASHSARAQTGSGPAAPPPDAGQQI